MSVGSGWLGAAPAAAAGQAAQVGRWMVGRGGVSCVCMHMAAVRKRRERGGVMACWEAWARQQHLCCDLSLQLAGTDLRWPAAKPDDWQQTRRPWLVCCRKARGLQGEGGQSSAQLQHTTCTSAACSLRS